MFPPVFRSIFVFTRAGPSDPFKQDPHRLPALMFHIADPQAQIHQNAAAVYFPVQRTAVTRPRIKSAHADDLAPFLLHKQELDERKQRP